MNPRHTETFRPDQWMWADHLTIARCCACIAEHDLTEAAALMGGGMHLLQRDFLLESVRAELLQEVVQSA